MTDLAAHLKIWWLDKSREEVVIIWLPLMKFDPELTGAWGQGFISPSSCWAFALSIDLLKLNSMWKLNLELQAPAAIKVVVFKMLPSSFQFEVHFQGPCVVPIRRRGSYMHDATYCLWFKHLLRTFNFPSLFFAFQSQTEDNPGSKMDLSVGMYHSTNTNGIHCYYIGIPYSVWVGMGAVQ